MNENILKRRSEMVTLRSKGLSLLEVVKDLHVKYDLSKSWLYQDWKDRQRWLPMVLDLKDLNVVYWDLVACHQEIKRLAFLQYYKADNSSSAVGALNLIRAINLDFMQMFPRSLIAQASGKKGADLNELLEKYEHLFKVVTVPVDV